MEHLGEAELRALEPTLGSASSPASRRAVVQLARMPPEIKENRLVGFALWDLGNLVRCALAAGTPADARWGEHDMPVLCIAAHEGDARSLKALLTGGADVRMADKKGCTALHWAAWKGDTACIAPRCDPARKAAARAQRASSGTVRHVGPGQPGPLRSGGGRLG